MNGADDRSEGEVVGVGNRFECEVARQQELQSAPCPVEPADCCAMLQAPVAFSPVRPRSVASRPSLLSPPRRWITQDGTETKTNLLLKGLLLESTLLLVLEALLLELLLRRSRVDVDERTAIHIPGGRARRGGDIDMR